ncbi:hypothetical protein HPB49_019168 [Dermacentor silvarum]|uniref:Uncharacterized protein n=1 Tax=Dermacentor silvarum TaxID=543639 RepID=A0ACB8D7U0_DERSI|nr:hypothetical protein HPB49_019168 [Dermacentor silvarum]
MLLQKGDQSTHIDDVLLVVHFVDAHAHGHDCVESYLSYEVAKGGYHVVGDTALHHWPAWNIVPLKKRATLDCEPLRDALLRSTPHLRPTPPGFAASAETVRSPPSRRHGIQVEGVSITPAELEVDSRWIRGVKAHRAAAAHQAIASTPPASPPSTTPPPPPAATPTTTTLRRHAPLPGLPAEDFNIVFRQGGGLDLRTTTNGALLQILCTLATIDYAFARTADGVRINPYNKPLTVSTPSEPRARLYLRVSELRLGRTSYTLRAYMAAADTPSVASYTTPWTPKPRTRSSKIYNP